ncbi:four helix bundle protein [Scytonema hofmannii]|uniref:four helix bundle protein n=1 Tax=Scytonema hofmannii TaxID=34078 RepID=UPI00034CBA31|nr:four helix bundle protein [Scytonema hofmannii]
MEEARRQLNTSDFWWIAQGSVNELETHIILSYRVGLSKQEDVEPIVSLLREESRMIIALIKKLE